MKKALSNLFFALINFSIPAMIQPHELINIKKVNPTIHTDVIYATNKNFTKEVIYTSAQCYLHKEAAQALSEVQKELAKQKLGLKIWDGYRPLSAQWKLWNICAKQYPDQKERENYVSNPVKGGWHTRGTAVDVTLIDLETGKELEMPTEFDHFGPEAWRNYQKLPATAKKNSQLLEDIMKKYGFDGLPSEWWHFDYKGWKDCAVLDIDFEILS